MRKTASGAGAFNARRHFEGAIQKAARPCSGPTEDVPDYRGNDAYRMTFNATTCGTQVALGAA
jgi:hypothetical protein